MSDQKHVHTGPGNTHDTPQPTASSGMRFDELYRLKGVVSCSLGKAKATSNQAELTSFLLA